MARFTPAQINAALKTSGYGRTASTQDVNNAQKFGLGIFKANQKRIAGPTGLPGGTPAPSASTPNDVVTSFLDQVRGSLSPAAPRPHVKPFDQSGFFNEADTRSIADSEYDPFYQKEQGYQQSTFDANARQQALQRAADDKARQEAVNAAGGYRSSAYQQEGADQSTSRESEAEQQRQALMRSLQQGQNDQKSQKEQFVLNRRNDAFQRYQQSLGTLTP